MMTTRSLRPLTLACVCVSVWAACHHSTCDPTVILSFRALQPQVPVKGDDGKILRWDSKGIGILSVRKPKQDGAKPYIALFTESVGLRQGAALLLTEKVSVH